MMFPTESTFCVGPASPAERAEELRFRIATANQRINYHQREVDGNKRWKGILEWELRQIETNSVEDNGEPHA